MLGFVGWAGFICPRALLLHYFTDRFCSTRFLILVDCSDPSFANWASIGRLGKQLHRLPNISFNFVTDVGLDEASPTYGLDLGDISSSGAMELMMPIWLRVWGKLGQTTVFNYKIVR